MKQRITYLVKDPDTFTPEQLEVKDGSLAIKGIQAVKEHRITFSLDELPSELRNALTQWQELHIKWVSQKPYTAIPPFTSRVTPGLHVFFEPQKTQSETLLCDILHSAFSIDLKCSSTKEAATPISYTSKDAWPDVSLQYYSYLPSLSQLASYIQEYICSPSSKSCKEGAASILEASYLDIDYTPASSSLLVTAFFNSPPQGWTSHIPAPTHPHTTEVGVLTHEKTPDPEDIAFGGFLTVLGRDAAPKPTRFQTPTRHFPLPPSPLSYTTTFAHPTGLHPVLHLTLAPSSAFTPPDPPCKLYTHLTLPSTLFLDKYAFTDSLFLSAHNLRSLTHVAGATDLEAPEWVVQQWGSAALFEVALPSESGSMGDAKSTGGGEWNISIPLHLRYLPAAPHTHTPVPLPWPVVFFACPSSSSSSLSSNPFDRQHLSYSPHFSADTRFMHVPPVEGAQELVAWVQVPVLDTRAAGWVEAGTVGVVVLAFLGICWALFGGTERRGEGKSEKKMQ